MDPDGAEADARRIRRGRGMTHEEMSEMYELYALGVLTPSEKAEFDEHLGRGCPECRSGLAHAMELNAMMALLPDQVSPPKRLRKRVLASIGSGSPVPAWTNVWALVAGCLAIALVVGGLKMASDIEESRREARTASIARDEARRELDARDSQLSQVRRALQLLDEPQTVQATFGGSQPLPPRGKVFLNPTHGVLLIASHLAPAPAGKAYEMWLIPKKGAPLAAGVFQSDAQGNAFHFIPGPVDRAATAAVAVTVEQQSGSSTPTTKPFIVAPLGE